MSGSRNRPVVLIFIIQTGAVGVTHNTVDGVEVDEAEIHLVAGQLASVVQTQDYLVAQQVLVHLRHAALQVVVQLQTFNMYMLQNISSPVSTN